MRAPCRPVEGSSSASKRLAASSRYRQWWSAPVPRSLRRVARSARYARGVARNEVRLRRIESPAELAPANELAREFGDWATERIWVELDIVVAAGADHPVEVLDDLLASGGRLYVAEVDGVAVGVGGLRRLSDSSGEIKRMFVRPTARGMGVGRAIVEQLVDDARALGFETIYLESASFMHSAHALYRSVGFVPSDPYAGREFEGVAHDVSILMRLDLA
jgi:GNAT superfamily N-acetyltransferase